VHRKGGEVAVKFDVVGFGALNVDRLYRVNRIAREGEESFITDFHEEPGGSAANTIVGLARLGLKTGYIGKVANDREGESLLEAFRREGVNTEGVVIANQGRSGVAHGYVDAKGERALYIDPGANDTLTIEEVSLDYASQTRFLHLTSFIGEKPFNAQKTLVKRLPNLKVSFDPGEIYARKGLTTLKPLVKRSHVVFLNENEMKILTGKGYREGAKILLEEGAGLVVVKLGEKGCFVYSSKESGHIKPYPTEVVDTTGAGDAFCAGFLYGLIKGKDLFTCAKLGNFVASRCIAEVGARKGLPRLPELRKLKFSS
jgi:ribokinase